jgi:hypothetical protein
MDLPVELVGLLNHSGINGKKLTWDLQVNSNAVSVKLMWIKAAKPIEKTGEITTKLVFKHRQTTSTPLQMKRRKQSSSTATPKPSTFQQY